jgi:hypothetical protein
LERAGSRSAWSLSDDADEGNRAVKLASVDATKRLRLESLTQFDTDASGGMQSGSDHLSMPPDSAKAAR